MADAGAVAAGLPPLDTAEHPATVSGNAALGPDHLRFAHVSGAGFATVGLTTLSAWLGHSQPAQAPPASVIRVVRAVSQNEGRLEAINSYDNAHLSFGMLQWTMGPLDQPGELPGLLAALKAADAATFADCFGQYGLDVPGVAPNAAQGRATLHGVSLATSAQKDALRSVAWAYRFWRAGHADAMRLAELGLAAVRIPRFASLLVHGHRIDAWMTSELGVALVLDEHVNRPGHVPSTVGAAVTAALAQGLAADPAGWATADEQTLIAHYRQARAQTNMTDPEGRAQRIAASAAAGALSQDRGSFRPA